MGYGLRIRRVYKPGADCRDYGLVLRPVGFDVYRIDYKCRKKGSMGPAENFASRRGGASVYYLAESQCAGRGDVVCPQRGVKHSYHSEMC